MEGYEIGKIYQCGGAQYVYDGIGLAGDLKYVILKSRVTTVTWLITIENFKSNYKLARKQK